MQTAVNQWNCVPNAALDNTPCKAVFGEDTELACLRAIGAREIVRVDTHTIKLGPRAREGHLVGYTMDSEGFPIYNPANHNVRETRNVKFIETPSSMIREPHLASFGNGEFTHMEFDELLRKITDYASSTDRTSVVDLTRVSKLSSQTTEPRQRSQQSQEVAGRDA